MMQCIMDIIKAASVPGRGCRATSACLDMSWKRTSMTMSFVMPAAWFLNTSLHQAVSMAGF